MAISVVFLVLQMLNRRPRGPLLGAGFLYRIWSPTGLQTPSGVPRAPSAGCGFPYHISSLSRLISNYLPSFDRHQAEITVMQFRGHSLSVYQSMSVFCPISSAKSAYAISFDYWPLECVTSFRCITLEWHVWPGRRSVYNIRLSLLLFATSSYYVNDCFVYIIL